MAGDPGEEEAEDERASELSTVAAIYPELTLKDTLYNATIDIQVEPINSLPVVFPSLADGAPPLGNHIAPMTLEDGSSSAVKTKTVRHLAHLPPLKLDLALPDGYPSEKPPLVDIRSSWLPRPALTALKDASQQVWERMGKDQAVFAYIDYLRDAADNGFGLSSVGGEPLDLSPDLEISLLDFDLKAKRAKFEQETFECGICLGTKPSNPIKATANARTEPKKGSACHRLQLCSHVFCVECMQDFYSSCITEGDISNVKCTAINCGLVTSNTIEETLDTDKMRQEDRSLEPSELLQIPLSQETVQRYIKLKRKKRLESDRSTVYCPRQWCQGPARWKKSIQSTGKTELVANAVAPEEPTSYDKNSSPETLPPPSERLAICEDCTFAFCKVCKASWHGEYYTCFPRSRFELTAEERASEDYMKLHTQPCPTCDARAQKTHGCNHMICFKCDTHYCYLCGAFLDRDNPYTHYNTLKSSCYMRLWELEGGDDGEIGQGFGGGHGGDDDGSDDEDDDTDDDERDDGEEVVRPANPAMRAAPPPGPDVRFEAPPLAQRGNGNGQRGGRAANPAPRLNQGLQRFIQMAENDEEDDWDSDDLSDDADFD